jgi:formiminoglutamase
MTWADRYIPPSNSLWQGRTDSPDASCFFQVIHLLDLQNEIPAVNKPAFALLGFNCDEGIRRNLGRLGAADGPAAIRATLAKLPIHRRDIVCYDAGDISCTDNNLEEAQAALGKAVFTLLQHEIIPIVLGGGHEVAWGNFQGIEKRYPDNNLGIINMDAHLDMRPLLAESRGSSGTPFLQIAEAHNKTNRRFDYNCIGVQNAGNIRQLFNTAKDYQVQIAYADDIQEGDMQKSMNLVNNVIYYNQVIYLSICLDVFASAYAPGVSAPQALGLTPWQVIPAIRKLAASGKVVSYDIAELSPKYDIDLRTTKLAANLIYEIIHHHKM